MKFKIVTEESDIKIPTKREETYEFYNRKNFLGVYVCLNWYNDSDIFVFYYRIMRENQIKKPSVFKTKSKAISSISRFLNIK